MPPDVATSTPTAAPAPAPSPAQETAALEGAFSKAIDGGARGRDPVTKRFTSAKAAPARAADAPATESTVTPALGDGATPQPVEAAPSSEPAEQQSQADPSTETPIEPPASWSKEDRAEWDALNRRQQEVILRRDREDTAAMRRGQNESAEVRKAVEAERKAVSQERQQLAQTASLYVSEKERQFIAAYGDVRSLSELSREDAARYVQMMADLEDIRLQKGQQAELQARVAKQAEKELADFRAAEDRSYREANGLTDDAKWKAAQAEFSTFAKEVGIPDEEMAQASRLHLDLMRDAMLYRRSQKALQTAKAAGQGTTPAPSRVQTPGTTRGATGKDEQEAASMKQLRATGSVNDAEAAFARALLKGASRDSNQRNVR